MSAALLASLSAAQRALRDVDQEITTTPPVDALPVVWRLAQLQHDISMLLCSLAHPNKETP